MARVRDKSRYALLRITFEWCFMADININFAWQELAHEDCG